jgi:hypothetical protein
VQLFRNQAEAGGFVCTPHRTQGVVGSQDDAPITSRSGKVEAMFDQTAADAQAARGGLDVEETQFGNLISRQITCIDDSVNDIPWTRRHDAVAMLL